MIADSAHAAIGLVPMGPRLSWLLVVTYLAAVFLQHPLFSRRKRLKAIAMELLQNPIRFGGDFSVRFWSMDSQLRAAANAVRGEPIEKAAEI